MPWTTGSSYAESGRPATLRSRLFWLRHNIATAFMEARDGLSTNTGGGEQLCRDWGMWMVRPGRGFRSRRWISVPLRATRSIPADDDEAAFQWWTASPAV
jgi:hypothetical protein